MKHTSETTKTFETYAYNMPLKQLQIYNMCNIS
jgi:hypothetical protein